MSIALGNGKPQVLLDVEKHVWRVLFQMVEGLDQDGLLLELVERIPWSALASLPEGDRQWFALSTTSSQIADSSLHQKTSSFPQSSTTPEASQALMNKAQTNMDESPSNQSALPHADGEVPTLPPSSTTPEASQALMNKAQTNMDESLSNQSALPHADGEVPMDTRPDAEHDSTVNESRDDAVNTSRLKRTSTSPRKALKKRQRRPGIMDHEDYMPSSDPSRETVLGHLLAAGESYSMPIDVEAVDMLMRNFPIIEEHQVRCAGYNSLKPYRIIF
jgi:hypothetical protein